MKATSQAALLSLQRCFDLLQAQHMYHLQEYQVKNAGHGHKKHHGRASDLFNAPRRSTK
jgi:hypothetical protein